MLTARFLAMPAIALTVIVTLAQAHSQAGTTQSDTRTVYRAVNCSVSPANADPSCVLAGSAGVVR